MKKELYKKHRPPKLKYIVGQDSVVNMIEKMIEKERIPHTILISGPSGCGKTTIARILKRELKCGKADFYEINGADKGGIDDMRRIRSNMHRAPIAGDCRIWLIDEAHKITAAGQDQLLKMLEDTPEHIYFILCTTDPQNLKKAIKTRSTELAVRNLSDSDQLKVIKRICKKEKIDIKSKVIKKIIECSEGSARKALVLLNQIMDLDTEKDMIEVIQKTSMEVQAFVIARALINRGTKWPAMSKILKDTANEDPEGLRWMILGYAKSCLLGNVGGRAYNIIESFRDNFYDSKHAGLVAACYEVIVPA